LQTDKLYDALGSTTFAALAIGTLTYAKYYFARQIVATVLVIVWAARLGSFLLFRVLKTGRDSRFDEAKKQPCESPDRSQTQQLPAMHAISSLSNHEGSKRAVCSPGSSAKESSSVSLCTSCEKAWTF
jgi:steroid 5-alpha reductase family enzyme